MNIALVHMPKEMLMDQPKSQSKHQQKGPRKAAK